MAQENIKIELPITGETCEMKPFITHRVSEKAQKALIGSQEIDVDAATSGEVVRQVKLTGGQALELKNILVLGLVLRIGDKSKSDGTLDEEYILDLPEDDFTILADKAMDLFNKDKDDPKGLESGNKSSTVS